jgi:hypothetical protein
MIGNKMKGLYSHMTMQICNTVSNMRIGSRLIGLVRKEIVMSGPLATARPAHSNGFLLALRGLGMGPSPLCLSLFQSTAADYGEVVAFATNCGEPYRHF